MLASIPIVNQNPNILMATIAHHGRPSSASCSISLAILRSEAIFISLPNNGCPLYAVEIVTTSSLLILSIFATPSFSLERSLIDALD